MPTLIVDITDSEQAARVADTLRLMKSVKKVFVREDDFERIPGLPYTKEEYMADIRAAEGDYAAGRTIASDELKKRMAAW